jgi:hypothetical protein
MTWHICNASRPSSVIAGATLTARLWRAVREHLFARYHPERHYMRGPGPKWREKHGLERRLGHS